MGVFDVVQIPCSAVEREHETVIEAAAAAGSAIVVRCGAGKGAPSNGKRKGERWARAEHGDVIGDSPMEFILRFPLSNPDLATIIVGTANPTHLRDNVAILLKGQLPADTYGEGKQRLAAADSAPVAA
jgi:aryl-alcohol dehydrogenase-like predicted oxidoreductase